jgi:subtilisin family serine protease
VTFAAPALPIARQSASIAALGLSLALVLGVAAGPAPRQSTTHAGTGRIQFLSDGSYDDLSGSLYNVNRQVNADSYWANGYTGAGVDVALIDSGTAPVTGLDGQGKVVYGPDVSFESGQDNLRNLDTFGHGSHMAGIIAGRSDTFRGVAYGARIVSLKAADAHGQTDLAQIISEIKWVTQHAHDNGLNIRVLNLSFGAIPSTGYRKDDLAYAVEKAWNAGIVTVVAAGNEGAAANGLDTPAFDPFVIAVGADNPHGTTDVSDDNVSSFSSRGNGARDPDVIAPGKSVVSLRVAGSLLDSQYPDARVGEDYFRGSGTSQAAAVVSGAAALIVSQRPNITPDQVKSLLMSTARPIPNTAYSAQGAGLIDLQSAFDANTPNSGQYWQHSNGSPQGVWWSVADATGNSWSAASSTGNSWSGNSWTGDGWSGPGWDDDSYINGNSWSAGEWLSLTKAKTRGVCTEWFLAKKDAHENGVSWGRKTKKVNIHQAVSRDEFGVSWGKRGQRILPNRMSTVAFCDWKHEQWESKNVVGTDDSDAFRELGVSWGRRHNGTLRAGWRVE